MKISFSQVCRDYLALRGESPDLLPLLEEGEESAVLTLRDELLARLPAMAVKATLETPVLWLDETRTFEGALLVSDGGVFTARMPADYLRLVSVRMADWKEPLTCPEPPGSLRDALGANAPAWMTCRCRPMVREERDADGISLKIYGSSAGASAGTGTIVYAPVPTIDGEWLVISSAAYRRMILEFRV